MKRHIIHLRISEQTTAVELRYEMPGLVLEYFIVRTRAEFWATRMMRETYFVGMPLMVDVAAKVSQASPCHLDENIHSAIVREAKVQARCC